MKTLAKLPTPTAPFADRIVTLIKQRARLWRDQEMTELRAGRRIASELSHAKAVECEVVLNIIAGEREAER